MTEIKIVRAARLGVPTYQQGYARISAQFSGRWRVFGLDSNSSAAKLNSCFGPSGQKYGNPAGSNRRGLPHLGHGKTAQSGAAKRDARP